MSNFDSMPFDESLFESNEMMKTYWERSTENRSVHFSQDVRNEERQLPDDIRELHELSMSSYESNSSEKERDEAPKAETEEIPKVPTDAFGQPQAEIVLAASAGPKRNRRNAEVSAKALSKNHYFLIISLSVVGAFFLLLYAYSKMSKSYRS
jgi:hypothetical protein